MLVAFTSDELDFIWDTLDSKWNEGYELYKQYINEFNSTKVPQKYMTKEGFKLGQWVNTQKRSKTKMSPDRIAKLDELGFIWAPKVGGNQNLK